MRTYNPDLVKRFKLLHCICGLLVLILFGISDAYLADMFVHECVKEHWFIFPWNHEAPKFPYVIISMCHAIKQKDLILNHVDTTEVKPIARFSRYSFFLDFVSITNDAQAEIWLKIYERLMITSIQRRNFHKKFKTYKNDYPIYSALEFKMEFLRSRWNIDRISLYESHSIYRIFVFQDHHLPTSQERKMSRKDKLDDLREHGFFIRILSGRGHQCTHANILEKLASLTRNYNAYDRIFCDAFEYHNLTLTGYWNSNDMFYLRGRLIRDEILSSFPTESVSLFYASPMITFVVLEREPVPWMFIFRPFPFSLWGLIFITVCTLAGARKIHKMIQNIPSVDVYPARNRYKNTIEFIVGLYKTVIVSAYSGMVLFSILYPLHAWTPSTFKELNATKDYIICTSAHAPIKVSHMTEKWVLNRIPETNWLERKRDVPAEYFESWLKGDKEFTELSELKGKSAVFIAALMYDDKVNLWLKGREFLWRTQGIFDQIKPVQDKVLSEIRYVSVPSGATRLHFLIETMKRGFTCGVWMRYYNLEMNYYKNVAPILVKKLKTENRNSQRRSTLETNGEKRPLTWSDLYSCFILLGLGLMFASLLHMLQNFCRVD